jgi:hypothetical protein
MLGNGGVGGGHENPDVSLGHQVALDLEDQALDL